MARRRAFTVLEMMVALAVFMVLLAAVFVPIKLAGDLSGVGTARANTQAAAVEGIRQIRNDIKKAILILPNGHINGITDVYPYSNNANGGNSEFPYRLSSVGYTRPANRDSSGTSNLSSAACNATTAIPSPNTSRLDLILPAASIIADTKSIDPRLRSGNVLVSYYARRLDITKAFDPVTNPVVLFRAQIPFQYYDTSASTITIQPFPAWESPSSPNANLSDRRFDSSSCNARGLQWLTMNQYGEFDLTPLAIPPASYLPTGGSQIPTYGAQQLVMPRDTALITPNAVTDTDDNKNPIMSLVPDTSFICSDTNKDGKLDTVKIQLSVGQYDENSVSRRTLPTPTPGPGGPSLTPAPHAVLQPQIARTLTETVFDPNIQ